MNASIETIGNTKQGITAWVRKRLSIILIILLIIVDDYLVPNLSVRWIPVLGFIFGVSFACSCFGVYKLFPLLSKFGAISDTQREINALITGIPLMTLGAVILLLNDSLASVFSIQWLHTFEGSFVIGMTLTCLGYWIITVFTDSELKGDFKWKLIGVVLHSLVLIGVIIEYVFDW